LNDPVVIAAFRQEIEAGAAQDALEREGIVSEAGPRDDELDRLCADVFNAGFDVVVDRDEAEDAIAVLRRHWPDVIDVTPIEPPVVCPACSSPAVARLPRVRLFFLAAIVLLIAGVITGQRELFLLLIGIIGGLLAITPPLVCDACGERWRGRHRVLPENAIETTSIPCPRCGSLETETIDRRRNRALTLLVNWIIPPTLLVWPFLARRRCIDCGNEWR
jgi:DNA-directed RNA polymerase subunit RPC12/RpoP